MPAHRASGFVPPPPRPKAATSSDPRIVRLERQRDELIEAIERVEASSDPQSPYQQRLLVLEESLRAVEAEIDVTSPLERVERPELPETPIDSIAVTLDPAPAVELEIAGVSFRYAEAIDWAERGHQIVRGDLELETGDPNQIVPADLPDSVRSELARHLERSLFALATDMRDHAIEGRTAPVATLADLARICPKSGDWMLWGGVCSRCIEHEARLRDLNAVRTRLLDQRTSEIEERQRQVEELPIQRRRLARVLEELQAAQS